VQRQNLEADSDLDIWYLSGRQAAPGLRQANPSAFIVSWTFGRLPTRS
jgi:hypothetical protein